MSPSLRSKLAGSVDYLAAAREVVEVVKDLPVDELDLRRDASRIDRAAVEALDARWGLGSSLERIIAAIEA